MTNYSEEKEDKTSASVVTQKASSTFDTELTDNPAQSNEGRREITKPASKPADWLKWFDSLKQVLPIYISIHLAFLILTYLAALFTIGNFSTLTLRLRTMLDAWNRWDSGHFVSIATNGYYVWWKTAFFPLFPLLERGVAFLTGDAFVAGLIIANLAGLGMLVVLYRLVKEEFDAERAFRTTLYLSIFPTAFFFAAAYNETLFLFFTLLSFYFMRRSNWWRAGLLGFVASLTRSVGICLLLPFVYEYLRQHAFQWKKIRLDIVSSLAIPAGIGVFALYCYVQFHDPLAFSHAQVIWNRHLHGPWHGLIDSFFVIILHRSILSFDSIHNVIDLSACLFVFILIVLSFIGPWRFSRDYWVYGLYAVLVYIFSIIYPTDGSVPLAAFSRYMLEVFPAFIVLAAIGKKVQFNLYYLMLSVSILSFMLLQFLTGRWII